VDELARPKTPGGGAQADGGTVWSASLACESRGGEPNGDPDPATEADPEVEPRNGAEPGTDAEPAPAEGDPGVAPGPVTGADPWPPAEGDPKGAPGPATEAEPETAAEPVTGPPGANEPRCGRVLLR